MPLKPVVLLINGLMMYQPAMLTPLYPLSLKLEAAGFQTHVVSHLNDWNGKARPDIIIGHSQGGATAMTLAHRFRPKVVITFDAVRMVGCPSGVRCYNFQTPGYRLIRVPGADNIPVMAEHASMVLMPSLQAMAISLAQTASRVPALPLAAESPTKPAQSAPTAALARAASPAKPRKATATQAPQSGAIFHRPFASINYNLGDVEIVSDKVADPATYFSGVLK